MQTILIVLIGIHGIIHLLGFLKAFGISEVRAISRPISKAFGLFWFLSFLLFAITIFLIIVHSDYWWVSGILGLIVSQVLIFSVWSDAKFGTFANLIILLAAIIGYSNFNFKQKIKRERQALLESSQFKGKEVISKKSINHLPMIVQKWLMNSKVLGNQPISNVYLTQELQLKLKPEQENWDSGKAEQYFTTQPPAFNWSIHTKMNSVLEIVGRDKFSDGKGEMIIKLLSLIPVANVKNDKKTNQSTLQRYLAEIVWFPSAALSQYIKWETIDNDSAKATMEYKGTQGSGVFQFDKDGNIKKFKAMRYKDSNDSQPTEWSVIVTKIKELNGVKIPIECEASWKLKNGPWTWLRLKVTDIQYNVNNYAK